MAYVLQVSLGQLPSVPLGGLADKNCWRGGVSPLCRLTLRPSRNWGALPPFMIFHNSKCELAGHLPQSTGQCHTCSQSKSLLPVHLTALAWMNVVIADLTSPLRIIRRGDVKPATICKMLESCFQASFWLERMTQTVYKSLLASHPLFE